MGIYTWRKSALLIVLLLVAPFASSATQVKTPVSTFSNIMNAAQGAVNLPYGDVAFFGPEFVAEHSAGSRFNAGDKIPGTPSKVKVAIKPVVTINPAKLGKSAVASIKGGGVPGLVAQAAVLWAIDQIPGAEILDGKPVRTSQPEGAAGIYWETSRDQVQALGRFADSTQACKSLTSGYPYWYYGAAAGDFLPCYGSHRQDGGGVRQGWVQRVVYNCPYGVGDNFTCNTSPPPGGDKQPFTDSDYNALEDALAQVRNSDWLRDLTRAKCEGSLAPEACYQDLVDRRPNHGPETQTTPPVSSTKTTTNPDGSTSTTTTTTQNKYNYNYTQNNFTYRTTTTTTTTKDGETTTEVEEDTTDPAMPDYEEPSSDDDQVEFTDSEFPEVTPFYDQRYPGGLSGVWQQATTDIGNSAFLEFLSSFVPSFSGTCPTFSLQFNIASWANFGTISFWNMCWIFDFIKTVLIVSAVFLARALTFGG